MREGQTKQVEEDPLFLNQSHSSPGRKERAEQPESSFPWAVAKKSERRVRRKKGSPLSETRSFNWFFEWKRACRYVLSEPEISLPHRWHDLPSPKNGVDLKLTFILQSLCMYLFPRKKSLLLGCLWPYISDMGPLPLCQLLLLLARSAALNQWIDHLSVSESQGYSRVIGISHQWKCKNERKTPLSSFHLPTLSFISMQFESTSDPLIRVRMLWSKSIDVLTFGSLFFFFLFSLHHIHFSLASQSTPNQVPHSHVKPNSFLWDWFRECDGEYYGGDKDGEGPYPSLVVYLKRVEGWLAL